MIRNGADSLGISSFLKLLPIENSDWNFGLD